MSCIICGEELNKKFSIKMDCSCNSEYHYECIFTTLKNDKYNKCPYCAKPYLKLPLINGLKRIDPKVHKIDENNEFESVKCQAILKSGKNKNNKCDKNCKLGYYTCARHIITSTSCNIVP
jgi:hypothetical protein